MVTLDATKLIQSFSLTNEQKLLLKTVSLFNKSTLWKRF